MRASNQNMRCCNIIIVILVVELFSLLVVGERLEINCGGAGTISSLLFSVVLCFVVVAALQLSTGTQTGM